MSKTRLPKPFGRRPAFLAAAGGIALGAAGLLLRRAVRNRDDGMRAGRDAMPPRERAGYPPFDVPEPVADGVFVVDSLLPGWIGRVFAVRMTVFRLEDGGLLLYSPTRHGPAVQQALERIGPVRHLVAPGIAHWLFVRDWQRSCPAATTWASPGLDRRRAVKRSGLRIDHVLPDGVGRQTAPAQWGGGFGIAVVPGGLGFREVALFHRPSRTLALCDLAMNLDADKVPRPLRLLVRLAGMTTPDGMPPPHLRAAVRLRGADARRAMSEVLALDPERVVFAHGRWFGRDGRAALERSLRWLLRGNPE